ncbi:MFS transporter [Angustibacter aerolatus]
MTEPLTATEAPDAGTRAPARAVLVLGVVAVALNLRLALTAVPPLVERIGADLDVSRGWTGALTTLPVLCMGLFAPVAQRIAHRWGREVAIWLAVAALAVGSGLRLGGEHLPLLYLGTLVAGFGVAVGGTLLPGFVKSRFAGRAGAATAVVMLSMMGGAAAASALAVPLADALGSWPASLSVWAVPALVAVAAWAPVVRSSRHVPEPGRRVALPWRHGSAWLVAGSMCLSSLQFYSLLAWLPASYEARGWSAGRAGLLLSVWSATQILSGVAGPALADRVPDRRWVLVPSVACVFVGILGLLLAPDLAPWVWAGVSGLGLGSGFGTGLILMVDYAADPAASARLSAMAFLLSYSTAAVGPVLLGVLRDASGGYTVPYAVLAALAVPWFVVATRLHPRRPQTP